MAIELHPQGGPTRPRLLPTEVRRVEQELAAVSAEIAALPRPAIDALAPILAQAQRETARDLGAWLARVPDGEARYTAQVHRTVLAQMELAFRSLAQLDPSLRFTLAQVGKRAGSLAGHHLVTEIARYSTLFDGAPVHVPLNVARIIATGERALIPRYRTSAARYAGNVTDDLRRELAVALVKRESISQMIDRLAAIGGPRGTVALRGVVGEPGAVTKHIAEGLFARYRHWGERVVRTETQNAYNVQIDAGLRQARETIPDLKRRWDASADLRLCDVCAALDGAVAEIDGSFPNGITDAPAHPNCRCRVGAWRAAWSAFLQGTPQAPASPPPAPPTPRPATLPPPRPRRATLPPPPRPRRATLPPPAMPPAPPSKPLGPPPPPTFKKIAQVEQWAQKTWPHITFDLGGMHIDIANELMQEFHRLASDWPEVTARLQYFGTYRKVKAAGRFFRWGPHTYAHASTDGARIGFNPGFFGKPDKVRQALTRDVSTGWHPPGSGVAASVLTHEWGHQVDHLLATLTRPIVDSGPSTSGTGPAPTVADTLARFRRVTPATAALSRYALKNSAEAFAEAFAALRYTPASQQTEYTRRLGILLDLARSQPSAGSPTSAPARLARLQRVLEITTPP